MAKKKTEAATQTEDQGAVATQEHEHVHGPDCDHDHDHEHDHGFEEENLRIEPIMLELEDLTEEGKKKAEERAKRSIPDIAYSIKGNEAKPGAVTAMTIEIDRQAFLAEQTVMLQDLSRDVVLPGFRKGKAPLKLLQLRMGEDAIRSTVAALATNALRQEHAKQNFQFVAKPRIIDYTATGQEPVSIVAELETMPKVDLKDWSGMEVEVEERKVDDEAVNQRLEQLRRQNAVLESASSDATVDQADTIIISTKVTNDLGEPLAHLTKSNQTVYDVKRELPEQLAEQIIGKKAGDRVKADVPAKVTNRRGETIEHTDHWQVEITEIKKSRMPALDDEFAKDLGEHETLAALTAKIRTDLEKAEADRQHSEAFGKLLRMMVEKNPIDTPRSLLAHRQYELIMQDQQQLNRMGLRLDQVVTDTDKYLRDQRASADEMVKIQMLTSELAKRENLEVSDEDVDKEIARMAEETGRKPLAIRARIEAQKQLGQFRESIARKKISDYLLGKNKVKLVAPKPAEAEAETPGESAAEPVEAKKPAAKKKAAKKTETEE